MAISHLAAGEPIDVLPFSSALANARTAALFKTEQLEVIRLVLLAGKSLPPHKVAGETMIQCLEGSMDVTADGTCQPLKANQLMYVAGDVVHSLTAIEDASALVTIVLPRK
jgi:quercetin dioxygenase-like cupin family protein